MGILHRVELQTVGGDGSAPAAVIVKQAGADEGARFVAKIFGFYQREVTFYNHLADGTVRTPRCHAALHDPETDNFLLILEDLSDLRSADQLEGCSFQDAKAAMTALALLHARHWNRVDEVEGIPGDWESPNPEGFVHVMTTSWEPFVERFGDRLTPDVAAAIQRMPSVVDQILTPREPVTLAHGDFRLDNLFFDDDGVVMLDWQFVTKSSPARDIGYFLSQSLTVDDRRAHERELLDLYQRQLSDHGIHCDAAKLWDDYRRAILFAIAIPIAGGVQLDLSNDRATTLFDMMLERALTAITALDAVELMP